MTAFDARLWIQNLVKPHPQLDMDLERVIALDKVARDNVAWGKYKKIQMDSLMKELKRDSKANYERAGSKRIATPMWK